VFAVNSLGRRGSGRWRAISSGIRGGFWTNDARMPLVILATPPGLGSAAAFAVSDDGRAVGLSYGVVGSEHAMLWLNDASHTPIDLGMLAGDLRSEAYGICEHRGPVWSAPASTASAADSSIRTPP
jgi:probable HAF family extracellular repeat protein